MKFSDPEISGKFSLFKTIETDTKGEHPKYLIEINGCSNMNNQA